MTPGTARLWTGIGCVGTLVVLAIIFLALDLPHTILPDAGTSPIEEYLTVVVFFTLVAATLLPFDFIGGVLIPAACETHSPKFTSWLRQWSRSVNFQLVFFSITLFIYLQIGREIGALWLIALFAVMQVALVAGQELIWQTMTTRRPERPTSALAQFVPHSDPRFAGGITGLPGFETIVIPDDWQIRLQPSGLNMLLQRREAALKSGGRLRGLIAAMLWNTVCFTGAILISGSTMNSVADLVTVFLWFLLFSFAGLLVLPSLNRRGVFALDRHLASKVGIAEFRQVIREIDELTETDPIRSVSAESVFQPIPCPERRCLAVADTGAAGVPVWNVARTALFLTWAFGGPLARAVHCNVGRPELWAMMPTD